MKISMYQRMKTLIEETGDAYDICAREAINMDFADFAATMNYGAFISVLKQAQLTQRELKHILRRGCQDFRVKDPEGCWADFMAHYVQKGINANDAPRRRSPRRKWRALIEESVQ